MLTRKPKESQKKPRLLKWMMIKWVLIVFCVTGMPRILSMSYENEIKMTVDVLQSLRKPSHVVANLCWPKPITKELVSALAASKNPKSAKFVDEFDAKDLANQEKLIFLIDMACEGVVEFLSKAKTKKYFARPFRWLVINRPNENVIPPELNEIDILPDSEVYVSQFGNDTYDINLVYKISPSRDWVTEKYATWSSDTGLKVSRHVTELVIAMRRRDLAGETIATSMVMSDNSTLNDLVEMRFKEIDPVSKAGYNQLTALYEFTNATRRLLFTKTWGYNVNGTWTGMLGHLARGEAELPGQVMFVAKERLHLVDYMVNSFPPGSPVRFIFRQPPLSYQNNLYLLPFTASVWYCIGSFVMFLIGAMYINAYWEKRKVKGDEQKEGDTTVLIPNVSDATVFVMSAISQQGSTVELKGSLGRFVILILFLVFVFLYTAYSASIVVLLQSSSNQIRTLTDLLNSKLELGVEDTPYNRYLFMNEKEPIRKAIYDKKIAPSGSKPRFYEIADGVLQLQKKQFAFNTNLASAYKLMEKYFYEHEKCGLQEITYLQDSSPSMGARKGSPYREIFKLGLLRNAEFGLNARTNRIMFSKKPACTVQGGTFVSVSLVDAYPILLLLLYGTILGVLLLLAELLHHRRAS